MTEPKANALSPASPPTKNFLVRISETFVPVTGDLLQGFGAMTNTLLGPELFLIKTATPEAIRNSPVAKFARWKLPVEHSWPCNPAKTDGFIEKAAQALVKKFAERKPQAVFVGTLNPGAFDSYFKKMASNLRGRLLTLFPTLPVSNVEEQDPNVPTLFCMVGRSGLFCGMQSPKDCNGFYPGGSKHVAINTPDTISRAGAKIVEALHYLRLYREPPAPRAHWMELGASPGGMTSELLDRDYRVTAIDPAPLDPRLKDRPGLRFFMESAATFEPPSKLPVEAMLCDMNGPPEASLANVIRLSAYAEPGALVIFTLKLPRVESVDEANGLFAATVAQAEAGGLHLFAQTHLTYNRQELTMFFEVAGK